MGAITHMGDPIAIFRRSQPRTIRSRSPQHDSQSDRLAQIVFMATVQVQIKEMCDFELPARIGDDVSVEWPPLRRNARCDSFPHLSKSI